MSAGQRAHLVRAETPATRWELASRLLPREFEPLVRSAVGFCEWTNGRLVRHEYPSSSVVVVFGFGHPIRVAERDDGRQLERFPGGFVAGLDDAVGLTEHSGVHRGVRLELTPLGARRLFRVPMSELAGRIVSVHDLLPRAHQNLSERLDELASWDARFDLLGQTYSTALAAAGYASRYLSARPTGGGASGNGGRDGLGKTAAVGVSDAAFRCVARMGGGGGGAARRAGPAGAGGSQPAGRTTAALGRRFRWR